jgi:hypothetical protein
MVAAISNWKNDSRVVARSVARFLQRTERQLVDPDYSLLDEWTE